jgi:hypothetical protein
MIDKKTNDEITQFVTEQRHAGTITEIEHLSNYGMSWYRIHSTREDTGYQYVLCIAFVCDRWQVLDIQMHRVGRLRTTEQVLEMLVKEAGSKDSNIISGNKIYTSISKVELFGIIHYLRSLDGGTVVTLPNDFPVRVSVESVDKYNQINIDHTKYFLLAYNMY